MSRVKHYFITNRKTGIRDGQEFVMPDGEEEASDNLRFGEIYFNLEGKLEEAYVLKPEHTDPEKKAFLGPNGGEPVDPTDKMIHSEEEIANVLPSTQLFHQMYDQGLEEKENEGHFLFFVHGYATDLEGAAQTLRELHKAYVEPEDSPIKHLILFTWPAMDKKLEYRDDARDATQSGYTLARLFLKVQRFFRLVYRENGLNEGFCMQKIHLLCHSMGNRVLEAMLLELLSRRIVLNCLFGEALLVAADVDYDALEQPKPLYHLVELCERVHVYFHRKDRALSLSESSKNSLNRLGRWGAKNSMLLPDDVTQVDVTDVPGTARENFAERISNHFYFYENPEVVRDIKEVLYGEYSLYEIQT